MSLLAKSELIHVDPIVEYPTNPIRSGGPSKTENDVSISEDEETVCVEEGGSIRLGCSQFPNSVMTREDVIIEHNGQIAPGSWRILQERGAVTVVEVEASYTGSYLLIHRTSGKGCRLRAHVYGKTLRDCNLFLHLPPKTPVLWKGQETTVCLEPRISLQRPPFTPPWFSFNWMRMENGSAVPLTPTSYNGTPRLCLHGDEIIPGRYVLVVLTARNSVQQLQRITIIEVNKPASTSSSHPPAQTYSPPTSNPDTTRQTSHVVTTTSSRSTESSSQTNSSLTSDPVRSQAQYSNQQTSHSVRTLSAQSSSQQTSHPVRTSPVQSSSQQTSYPVRISPTEPRSPQTSHPVRTSQARPSRTYPSSPTGDQSIHSTSAITSNPGTELTSNLAIINTLSESKDLEEDGDDFEEIPHVTKDRNNPRTGLIAGIASPLLVLFPAATLLILRRRHHNRQKIHKERELQTQGFSGCQEKVLESHYVSCPQHSIPEAAVSETNFKSQHVDMPQGARTDHDDIADYVTVLHNDQSPSVLSSSSSSLLSSDGAATRFEHIDQDEESTSQGPRRGSNEEQSNQSSLASPAPMQSSHVHLDHKQAASLYSYPGNEADLTLACLPLHQDHGSTQPVTSLYSHPDQATHLVCPLPSNSHCQVTPSPNVSKHRPVTAKHSPDPPSDFKGLKRWLCTHPNPTQDLTDKEISRTSEGIASRWQPVGYCLGCDHDDIMAIRQTYRHHGLSFQAREMLEVISSRKELTVEKLHQAILDVSSGGSQKVIQEIWKLPEDVELDPRGISCAAKLIGSRWEKMALEHFNMTTEEVKIIKQDECHTIDQAREMLFEVRTNMDCLRRSDLKLQLLLK